MRTRSARQDETQRFSPKRGANPLDDAFGGNRGDLSGLEVGQPTLGLGEPESLHVGIDLLIEAGDEALREAGALPARELQNLRFEFAG